MQKVNEVTKYDETTQELIVNLRSLYVRNADDVSRTVAQLKRAVLFQLTEEWMRQHADEVLRQVGVTDVIGELKTILANRIRDRLLD